MKGRLLALALLLVTACSSAAASEADFVLSEGTVDGPGRLTGSGASTIQVTNVGEYSHTLVVTDEEGQVMGATGLVEPGLEATLAVDLDPGTYVFSCRIVAQDDEGNLVDHYEAGMHRTVIVES